MQICTERDAGRAHPAAQHRYRAALKSQGRSVSTICASTLSFRMFAHTIVSLTDEQALELRYYSADWLQSNLAVLYRVRPTEALSIFDGFLRPFLNAAPTFTKSSIGETTIAGEVQVTSEVSNGKAINSPIGKLPIGFRARMTPKKATPNSIQWRQYSYLMRSQVTIGLRYPLGLRTP
ncbi:hypothetical protein SPHINGOR109_10177 [Sphingorhabdus sp. 109]|nr:hypothetical protein SPHINGOR109_10177 [Sphingorhabdus sp. 109]